MWAAKSTSVARSVPPPRFVRHTVSALGLRRLLATASRQQDTFWIRYSRLHGAVGDEAWRTSSDGTSFIVRAIEGAVKCARVLESGEEVACAARELGLLEEPEALSSALAYFLVPQVCTSYFPLPASYIPLPTSDFLHPGAAGVCMSTHMGVRIGTRMPCHAWAWACAWMCASTCMGTCTWAHAHRT